MGGKKAQPEFPRDLDILMWTYTEDDLIAVVDRTGVNDTASFNIQSHNLDIQTSGSFTDPRLLGHILGRLVPIRKVYSRSPTRAVNSSILV